MPAGEGAILKQIEEIFDDAKGRELILVSHAPMMTSEPHGGYFACRDRVFHRDPWIPLPVIGSIFPLARILGVTDTDVMSSSYRNHLDSA